jgi:hypothetical protein
VKYLACGSGIAETSTSARSASAIERLTGVDRHADLQLVGLFERPVADRQRRPHRALGIVLVRHWRPEPGHDRIADELLHRPPKHSSSPRRCAW